MYVVYQPTKYRENITNKIYELIENIKEIKDSNNVENKNNESYSSSSSFTESSVHSVKQSNDSNDDVCININKNETIYNLAINIEKGIYNYTIKESTNHKIIKKWENKYFVQLYCDRFKTIYINLKTTPQLVKKILDKEITPQVFAFMTHQEMRPDQWNDIISIKMKRDESKYINRMEASTDIYQCRKCKSRKCTYYSAQIRSADEPMTVFISCLDCGQNWKN